MTPSPESEGALEIGTGLHSNRSAGGRPSLLPRRCSCADIPLDSRMTRFAIDMPQGGRSPTGGRAASVRVVEGRSAHWRQHPGGVNDSAPLSLAAVNRSRPPPTAARPVLRGPGFRAECCPFCPAPLLSRRSAWSATAMSRADPSGESVGRGELKRAGSGRRQTPELRHSRAWRRRANRERVETRDASGAA